MAQTLESDLQKHLYLEEVMGERALAKVKAWNEVSLQRLENHPL